MGKSLAVKYRPTTFDDVIGQDIIVRILKQQVEIDKYSNVYGFSGPTGVGKTTIARIFAEAINKGHGAPIEIDGASNNGVDSIREIVKRANERSLDSKYKIFIIDECHMITTAGWNAFLKALEEPPKYTIFMFATTDPHKVPDTIKNRMMRFNLTRISPELIEGRLKYICEREDFINCGDACKYISRISDGSLRNAIAKLEKSSKLSKDLTIENVYKSLGNFPYKMMFDLVNSFVDQNESKVIEIVEGLYNDGEDLPLFIDALFNFTLDLNKYALFQRTDILTIPANFEEEIKYATGITNREVYLNKVVNMVLDIKNSIRNTTSVKNIITIKLLNFTRGN